MKSGDFNLEAECFDSAFTADATSLPVPACQLWYQRGIALEKDGKLSLALRSARRAVETNEHDSQSLLLLSKLQRPSKHYVAAFSTAKKIVSRQPNDVHQELALMTSLVDVRQFRAADQRAQHILTIDPENRSAKQLVEQIRLAKKDSLSEIH